MKKYKTLEIEISYMQREDIITSSGTGAYDNDLDNIFYWSDGSSF